MRSSAATSPGMRLVFGRTGRPADVLELQPFTPRLPEPGEVLVRVLAAPINPADINTINGTYGVQPALPAVPGIEGCGVVEASDAASFQPGDLVVFLCRASSWTTHTTVPGASLFKLPPGLNPIQAAMLKTNPATAWRLLHAFEPLGPADWVVQNLGNSAVGRCVIQLARDMGVRTISFVRRNDVAEELRDLGANLVFHDDEAGAALAQAAMGGAGAALACNGVGGESALRLMTLLRAGGVHVTYGAMGRTPLTIPNAQLIFRDIRIRGLWITPWIDRAPADVLHELYRHLGSRVAGGALVQKVDRRYPLDAYRDALARLEAPDRAGKVLFQMAPLEKAACQA